MIVGKFLVKEFINIYHYYFTNLLLNIIIVEVWLKIDINIINLSRICGCQNNYCTNFCKVVQNQKMKM